MADTDGEVVKTRRPLEHVTTYKPGPTAVVCRAQLLGPARQVMAVARLASKCAHDSGSLLGPVRRVRLVHLRPDTRPGARTPQGHTA
jgi:hypothetical protein